MTALVREIRPGFVAEIANIDLRRPISPDDVTLIQGAVDNHPVLVFHGSPISNEQQIAFSRNFGTLSRATEYQKDPTKRRLGGEMTDASNLSEDSQVPGRRRSPSGQQPGQQALAYRWILQAVLRQIFAAVLPFRGDGWRADPVGRHACRLRRIAGQDEAARGRTGAGTQHLPLARRCRLQRVLGRGAGQSAVSPTSARARASRHPAASRSICLRTPRTLSAGQFRRGSTCCWSSQNGRPNPPVCTRTNGSWATL